MIVAIFAEHAFDALHEASTIAEARAFARGVHAGARLYGAGSVGAYVIGDPADEQDMIEMESIEEITRMRARSLEQGDRAGA